MMPTVLDVTANAYLLCGLCGMAPSRKLMRTFLLTTS